MKLEGFNRAEELKVKAAIRALKAARYETEIIAFVVQAVLPGGRRGMTYMEDTVILSPPAFSSQGMLNHVMEEELLHLMQKARGQAQVFGPRTAAQLEADVHAKRKFPAPQENG